MNLNLNLNLEPFRPRPKEILTTLKKPMTLKNPHELQKSSRACKEKRNSLSQVLQRWKFYKFRKTRLGVIRPKGE